MFYFFQKANEYLRCELRPAGNGFDLRIEEPSCAERIEHFPTYDEAMARWEDLRVQFNVDGWAGPFGRE